jgi:uncharacterized protein YgiM (DUF1202 family)
MSKKFRDTNPATEIEMPSSKENSVELEKVTAPIADDLVSANTTSIPVLGVVVGCDRLRVRKHSSTEAEVITTLPKNTVVKILGGSSEIEGWYYIQETKTKGYVMSKFIELQ